MAVYVTEADNATDREFIVAEISKSWVDGCDVPGPNAGLLLGQQFENVIEINRQRGYELHQFTLSQVLTGPDGLLETVIAVFRRARV